MTKNFLKDCLHSWRKLALFSIASFAVMTAQAATTYTQCAVEGGYCSIAGTRVVRYGIDTRWISKTVTSGIACTNSAFGSDPAYGTQKICQYETVTGPDLIVKSISQSPISPAPGQAVTFSAVVQNIGNLSTPANTTIGVQFSVDQVPVSWGSVITTLGAGASLTITARGGYNGGTFTWSATSGTHSITAFVDDVNRLAETVETNNKSSASLTIGSTATTTTVPVTTTTLPPVSGGFTTIDQAVADMSTPHEAIPLYPVYNWQYNPVIVMQSPARADIPSWFTSGTLPKDWCYEIDSWFGIFEAQGNTATNTRVEIKNIRIFILSQSTRKWSRVDLRVAPNTDTWKYPFNYYARGGGRAEADGGLSFKPAYPYFLHGYGNHIAINPSDVRAVFAAIEFRSVLDNVSGTDDRAKAKYVVNVGGDYWPGNGLGMSDWTYAPGIGEGRMLVASPSWRTATMIVPNGRYGATMSEMKTNPPPLQ